MHYKISLCLIDNLSSLYEFIILRFKKLLKLWLKLLSFNLLLQIS